MDKFIMDKLINIIVMAMVIYSLMMVVSIREILLMDN